MQLFVRTSCTTVYEVARDATVADVKALVESRQGFPSCSQGFVHAGRQLQDECSLHACGLSHGSTVHLVFRLLGGKGGFGALLRGQGRDGNLTTNFDACRDLQGRRLRHAEAEKKLQDWKAEARQRDLEKIALQHIRERAKETAREAAEKVDVDAVKEAQAEGLQRVQSAVQDALKHHLRGDTSGGSSSGGGSPPADGKRKPEAAAAQLAKRPRVMSALEEFSGDEDDDSSSDEDA